MDLTLVPFGKSKSNGLFNLTCHHGPEECHGNKVQACALVHIPNNSTKVKFISCVMEYMEGKSKMSAYPDKQCADTVGVTDYSTIRNCVDMQEGDNLMLSLKNKTQDLGRGDSLSVPTIVFNSMFNETAQTMSLTSFKSVLCGYIPGNDKLEECSGAVVNTATLTLALVTALFALLSQ
uniref:Uncharacterized protein n=1 Tax=Timema tahoe TaxID=61484 RepID=A0A7R9NYP2_9NEOP|nr:unnamed protein product [Timema tahoe]